MATTPTRPPRPSRDLAARREARRTQIRRRRRNALLAIGALVLLVGGAAVWVTRDDGGGGPASAGGGGGQPAAEPAPPPEVGVIAPEVTLPMPRRPVLRVRAQGGDGLEVRVRAQTTDGLRRAVGPWVPAAARVAVPPTVLRMGAGRGPLKAWVEVRDTEGRVARSGAVPVTVPPAPGSPLQVVGSVQTRRPFVALVFDDGLEPEAMRRIITILRARNAGGTYCFNGANMERWDARTVRAMRAAVMDGTLDLCSHGWSHRTSTTTPYETALTDLRDNAAMDRRIGVSSVPFYRPPYGALSPGIRDAAAALGYRTVLMWNVDPSDYTRPSASVLTERVVGPSGRGSIAVLHAIGTTADALPAILDGLEAKGLRAVTASRLMAAGRPVGWGGGPAY